MPYCPKCGKLVNTRDRFCKNCGERLNSQEDSREHYSHRQEPKNPKMKERKCAFCDGTGRDPGRGIIDVTGEKCRVCGESKKKGFNEVPKYYIECKGECKGKGRIDIAGSVGPVPHFRTCRDCGGTGWADPRNFE
jgi:hypothetical protein